MKFHLVVSSPSFAKGVTFFRDELGFTLEKITPSENPSLAVFSGDGINICLDKTIQAAPVTLRVSTDNKDLLGIEKIGPNGTKVIYELAPSTVNIPTLQQASVDINEVDKAHWTIGRAGMKYRNLLPKGSWDYVASHIQIPGSGKVPDWVHYHDAQFQVIYCCKGSAKLVYEDQGQPFIFNEGDCVLQPPHIRHQVLESYEDLEVVEIATPLQHSTYSDHEMKLPNDTFDPDRNFQGQNFIWSRSSDRVWHHGSSDSNLSHEISATGIDQASAQRGNVRVLRPVKTDQTPMPVVPFPEKDTHDFVLWFVLDGTAFFERSNGAALQRVSESDAITLINVSQEDMSVAFRDASEDFALLEVCLPSRPSES